DTVTGQDGDVKGVVGAHGSFQDGVEACGRVMNTGCTHVRKGLSMPRFAANLGYLFTERAMIERIGAAAAAGFKGIELQFPYDIPASAVKAEIEKHKLTILGVNTPSGDRDGEFGLAAAPGREKNWEVLFHCALDYITAVGGSAIHCLAG